MVIWSLTFCIHSTIDSTFWLFGPLALVFFPLSIRHFFHSAVLNSFGFLGFYFLLIRPLCIQLLEIWLFIHSDFLLFSFLSIRSRNSVVLEFGRLGFYFWSFGPLVIDLLRFRISQLEFGHLRFYPLVICPFVHLAFEILHFDYSTIFGSIFCPFVLQTHLDFGHLVFYILVLRPFVTKPFGNEIEN